MLLAQLAPLREANPQEAIFFYLFVGACSFILLMLVGLVTIATYFRRQPSIDSEFATKAEMQTGLATMKSEMHREVAGLKQTISDLDERNESRSEAIFKKLDEMFKAFNVSITELHRALGRLEGPK